MCWQRAATIATARDAPRAARGFVAEALAGVVGPRSEFGDDAELVVSELVANSVNAEATTVMISIDLHHSHLRLAVEDDADGVPELLHAAASDDHGRGLAIVEALTRGWGVSPTANGKQVWADVAIPAPYTAEQFRCTSP